MFAMSLGVLLKATVFNGSGFYYVPIWICPLCRFKETRELCEAFPCLCKRALHFYWHPGTQMVRLYCMEAEKKYRSRIFMSTTLSTLPVPWSCINPVGLAFQWLLEINIHSQSQYVEESQWVLLIRQFLSAISHSWSSDLSKWQD